MATVRQETAATATSAPGPYLEAASSCLLSQRRLTVYTLALLLTFETGSVGGLGHIGGAVHPVGNRRAGIFGYGLDEIMQAFVLAHGDGEADLHPAADGDDGVGVEAAVGPHRELSPGSTVAHPAQRLTQEVGGTAGGVGPALPQPGHQNLTGAGGDGQQRVIAPGAGVAVVAGALLGQAIGLADGGIKINGQRPRPGPAAPGSPDPVGAHGPTESCAGRSPEPALAKAGGGWRLDYTAEIAGPPTSAQRIGVVDALAASQRGSDQRHYLVAGVGPARRIAQVQALLYQLGKAEVQGHQAVVVEGDADAAGGLRVSIYWVLFPWGRFSVSKPLSQRHRSTFLPLQNADPTLSFGGFGLSKRHFC